MYTEKTNNVNKKQKEQTIKRWRETGFMFNVKEGSALEWRLAYSYDYMATTILTFLQDEETPDKVRKELEACQLFSFPVIRACLTTKGRISHPLLPEQVLFPLLTLTCDELFNEVAEKNPKFQKRIHAHDKIRVFLQLNNEYQNSVIKTLMKYQPEDGVFHEEKNKVTLTTFKLLTDIDLVAWLLDMVSDYIKLKSHDFDEGLLAWEEEIPYKRDMAK